MGILIPTNQFVNVELKFVNTSESGEAEPETFDVEPVVEVEPEIDTAPQLNDSQIDASQAELKVPSEKSLVITKDDVKDAEKMVKMASKDSKQIKRAMKKKDVKKGSKLCWKICGPCLKKNATDVANDAISEMRSD